MANLLRRLLRVAEYYWASPQFICCSATIGNLKEHTEVLLGRKPEVIENNGSSNGPQKFVFLNLPLYLNNRDCTLRRSNFSEAFSLFIRFVQVGLQILAFTKSRQGVERMYKNCRELLKDRNLSPAICSYRSGYFDREREEIEKE
jgi:DEAD/DEAH box helicase domain-containing protein